MGTMMIDRCLRIRPFLLTFSAQIHRRLYQSLDKQPFGSHREYTIVTDTVLSVRTEDRHSLEIGSALPSEIKIVIPPDTMNTVPIEEKDLANA